jgi:hypothetical protein
MMRLAQMCARQLGARLVADELQARVAAAPCGEKKVAETFGVEGQFFIKVHLSE